MNAVVGVASDSSDDSDDRFDRLLDILNHGMLALMISVGERTGLFDTMRSLPPSSASVIAAAAGSNERYVREWLAAMAVGEIVTHDPAAGTYDLPPDWATALARGVGGPAPIAGMFQHVALLGRVDDRIVHHFRQCGGVAYDTYEQLWAGGDSYDWMPSIRWRWITCCPCCRG